MNKRPLDYTNQYLHRMTLPTEAQQMGIAYAPMPFGAISFLSSSYMIYHILFQEPQKRARLYHRLVLAMNIALLPLSLMYVWSTLAVPTGTPYYANAAGNVNTCTAQGFLSLMFMLTVPTYYGSLVLQAYLGIKNNFNEEKYQWIEIPVHIVAYVPPFVYGVVVAATNNFNPNGSGCWYSKAPQGCESDPGVPCERGQDISYFIYIVGLSQVFLYFIFPPSVILSMYYWMKKIQRNIAKRCSGMTILRESARNQMMQSIYRQLSLYLFSFWFTWVWGLIHSVYQVFTGDIVYNLLIFSNCIFASQGFIYMIVYFKLQQMGRPQHVEVVPQVELRPSLQREMTVSDIRKNAQRKTETSSDGFVVDINIEESYNFNIFDGTPDQESPWARFIDQESVHSDTSSGKGTPKFVRRESDVV